MPSTAGALAQLEAEGLLYPCFCTRAAIAAEIARAAEAPHGPNGPLYPGTCRMREEAQRAELRAAGAPYALRLDCRKAAERIGPLSFHEMPDGRCTDVRCVAVDPFRFGDVVLARKEAPASYHLAVVVDDAQQGVTLVTRGADLLSATHIQRVLQALLGLPEPHYSHHRLILDATGEKLSKRHAAASLRRLRSDGATPEIIREQLSDRNSAGTKALAARYCLLDREEQIFTGSSPVASRGTNQHRPRYN